MPKPFPCLSSSFYLPSGGQRSVLICEKMTWKEYEASEIEVGLKSQWCPHLEGGKEGGRKEREGGREGRGGRSRTF